MIAFRYDGYNDRPEKVDLYMEEGAKGNIKVIEDGEVLFNVPKKEINTYRTFGTKKGFLMFFNEDYEPLDVHIGLIESLIKGIKHKRETEYDWMLRRAELYKDEGEKMLAPLYEKIDKLLNDNGIETK